MATEEKPAKYDLTEREVLNQNRDDGRVEMDNSGMPTTKIIIHYSPLGQWKRSRTVTFSGGSVSQISDWTDWVEV